MSFGCLGIRLAVFESLLKCKRKKKNYFRLINGFFLLLIIMFLSDIPIPTPAPIRGGPADCICGSVDLFGHPHLGPPRLGVRNEPRPNIRAAGLLTMFRSLISDPNLAFLANEWYWPMNGLIGKLMAN